MNKSLSRLHDFDIDLIGNQVDRLFDIIPQLIYVWDLQDYLLSYVSPRIKEILGYDLNEVIEFGGTFLPIIIDENLEVTAGKISKDLEAMKWGEKVQFALHFRHKDGTIRKFQHTATVLTQHPDGSTKQVIISAQDITEDVAKTNTIETKQHYLNESEKAFPYGSFEWEINSLEVVWSDGMFKLFEIPKEDFPNNIVPVALYNSYIPEEEKEKYLEKSQQYLHSDIPYYEVEHSIIAHNGVKKTFSLRMHIIEKEGIKFMKGITVDISQQKEIEQKISEKITELERQQARMEQAEVICKFGSWECIMPERIITWSEGMFEIVGIDSSNFENKIVPPFFYYDFIEPEEGKELRQKVVEVHRNKEETYQFHHKIIDTQGNVKDIILRAICKYDEEGNLVKYIGVSADVTQIENYKREIEIQLEKVEKSNQELEQFAYVASHDLQEPLRKIISFGERLEKKFGEVLGEDGRFLLGRMTNATQRMNQLIDDLLRYSRASRQMEDLAEISLNDIITNVLEDLEMKAKEKHAVIVADTLPEIEAQPIQMHQLFQNLISNSLKFVQEGVQPLISLKVSKASDKEVAAVKSLNPQLSYYKFILNDNGIGFEEQFSEKIFTIFHRLHGRSEYDGTGLGLAICRKIVEMHHGSISAIGQPNQGATFTIYLPLKQPK